MIVTAKPPTASLNGPRPINLNKDIPQVLQLLDLVFGNTMDYESRQLLSSSLRSSSQPSFMWRLSAVASKLSLGFIWEQDGRIIGNVTVLTTNTPGRYLVVNVAVHPNYRRQGIARALMQQVTNLVRSRHGNQIMLQVVHDNQAAIDLYHDLHYQTLGTMTAWYGAVSRLPLIDATLDHTPAPPIRSMRAHEWRTLYQLDTQALPPNLNWPEQLAANYYYLSWWMKFNNLFNGRQVETWLIPHPQASQEIIGMYHLISEWGRSHYAHFRIHPHWQGQLERPLIAHFTRRMMQKPRRSIRIDHPATDTTMNRLLNQANFIPKRTLTHMRLDL